MCLYLFFLRGLFLPSANRHIEADLPGQFYVWLASPEARFLKGKFVWTNWDAQELLGKAEEIKSSKLLNWVLDGAPM